MLSGHYLQVCSHSFEGLASDRGLSACYRILDRDPFNEATLVLHVNCLYELKSTSALFRLAHQLADNYPERSVTWYAIGCYYLMAQKTSLARRYLAKATSLDPAMAAAWIVFGHAFSSDGERDHAVSSYRNAARLLRDRPEPLLFVGIEYLQTSNLVLAEQYLLEAHQLAPTDPLVLNELGVLCFKSSK